MAHKPETMFWLSDARGVYIPRDFAKSFIDRDKYVSGVPADCWPILEDGPDSASNESYWDVWDEVLSCAVVTDEHGHKYTLHQDGDLWLIPEGMEWNEKTNSFDWPADFNVEN